MVAQLCLLWRISLAFHNIHVKGTYMISTKLFPQNRQRCTDSSRSLTIQLLAARGTQLSSETGSGSRALRLHPMHVRTLGVESMNEVIVQRAGIIQQNKRVRLSNSRKMERERSHTPGMAVWTCGVGDVLEWNLSMAGGTEFV